MKLNPKLLIVGRKKIDLHPAINTDRLPKINAPEKAMYTVYWLQRYCCHTKGKWQGRPFRLLPWQFEMIWRLFGTVDDDELRTYQTAFLLIPKKNGKTELMAALALYGLCGDKEPGAEVVSCARDRHQAGIAFQAAAYMVEYNPNTDALRKNLEVVRSRNRIFHYPTDSVYYVASGETKNKQGGSQSMILFDEVHEQPNDELWRTMTEETDAAREQQLIIAATTAGIYDPQSLYFRLRQKAENVRENPETDKTFLPVLYIPKRADAKRLKDNGPEGEETLLCRLNPAVDHIFSRRKMMRNAMRAWRDADPTKWTDYLRYRLNIDANATDTWMDGRLWATCGGALPDLRFLENRRCYGGLDLSKKWDLSALVLVFPFRNGPTVVLCRFYCPEEQIEKRSTKDGVPYVQWRDTGLLTATPGPAINQDWIQADIEDMAKRHHILDLGTDPYGAHQLVLNLEDRGVCPCTEILNSPLNMTEPSRNLMDAVSNRAIVHGNNPILAWNIQNLVMRLDAEDNIKPDKRKSRERIDGAYALILAWGRMMAGERMSGRDPEKIIRVIGG